MLSELGSMPAYRLAASINEAQVEGVLEASPAYETAAIYVDPLLFDVNRFVAKLQSFVGAAPAHAPRRHVIPVCYAMGQDLASVASLCGLTESKVVELHTSVEYSCAALGFCPGFAYLRSVPAALAKVPRLAQPRLRVEPGSVGVTGIQTGVYPLARPGGWHIIGRSPLTLVDLSENYFPIRPGDYVTFSPIGEVEFDRLQGVRL